jgi:hypothetical protein
MAIVTGISLILSAIFHFYRSISSESMMDLRNEVESFGFFNSLGPSFHI